MCLTHSSEIRSHAHGSLHSGIEQSMNAHMAVVSRPVETGKPQPDLGLAALPVPHWDGVADGARAPRPLCPASLSCQSRAG